MPRVRRDRCVGRCEVLIDLDDPAGWEIGMRRLREEVERRDHQERQEPIPAAFHNPPLLDFDLGRVRGLVVPPWFYEELRTLTSEMAPFIDRHLIGVDVRCSETMHADFALATLDDGSHQFLALPPRAPEKSETPQRSLARRVWKAITGS